MRTGTWARTWARTRVIPWLALSLLLHGCDDTDECTALKGLVVQRDKVRASAKTRALLYDRLAADFTATQARVERELRDLGLDLSETALETELSKRVARVPTATIARGTVAIEIPGRGREVERVSSWRIIYRERDPKNALTKADLLSAKPPMLRFITLSRDAKSSAWTLEVARMTVDQVSARPSPEPLPPRDDPGKVVSEFGFCGASDLRDRITALDKEIDALKDKAMESTVLLPMTATWVGLERRAQLAASTEEESRRLLTVLSSTAVASRAEIKALGVEGGLVVLEVWGSAREREAITASLPKEVSEALREPAVPQSGVVRFMVANRLADPSTRSSPLPTGP